MKNTLRLGSVSTGTLLMSDLIPAVLDVLRPLRLAREHRQAVTNITRRLADLTDDESLADAYWTSEESDDDYALLCQIAECYVPPFCYFGSLEGDGADIGVWIAVETLRDAVLDGDVIASDLSPSDLRTLVAEHRSAGSCNPFPAVSIKLESRWAMAKRTEYYHYINDHGNSTLYRRVGTRFLLVWEVV